MPICDKDIFVFEEAHNSRMVQVQIALRLVRLYERCHLRHIALEGALVERKQLLSTWYHKQSSSGKRAGVAIQLLKKGEISSAEFMGMVYPDLQVHGIEVAEEYNVVEEYDRTDVAEVLYYLSLPSMTREQTDQHNKQLQKLEVLSSQLEELDNSRPTEKNLKVMQVLKTLLVNKTIEAREFVIKKYADAWSLYQINQQLFEREDQSHATEEELAILEKIIALERFNQFDALRNIPEDHELLHHRPMLAEMRQAAVSFDSYYRFLQMASQRSTTMVTHTLNLLRKYSDSSVAMAIGAAHTAKVIELLEQKGKTVVLVPLRYMLKKGYGGLTYGQYRRKLNSLSVDVPGLLGALLDGRARKPPPVVDKPWFRAQGEISLLMTELAAAAAGGDQPPFVDIWDKFDFSTIEVNPASIQIENGEVFGTIAVNLNTDRPTIKFRTVLDNDEALDLLLFEEADPAGRSIISAIEAALVRTINELEQEEQVRIGSFKSPQVVQANLLRDIEEIFDNATVDEIASDNFLESIEHLIEPEPANIEERERILETEQYEEQQADAIAEVASWAERTSNIAVGVKARFTGNPEEEIPPIREAQAL